ncbi:MAG: NAD(P)-binding oxidoreductase [Pseudomonadota bacterium]
MKDIKKIAVIGASGGSGRYTVEALTALGHEVTAVSRSASNVFERNVRCIDGSAMDKSILKEAIKGQDAVIVTLGISENPIRVRLFGTANTPADIRSAGTKLVIEVMEELGVKRLVVQTSFGTGPTNTNLRVLDKLFFNLILKPQIRDTELQDEYVRTSALDWTITQPVHLTDNINATDAVFTSSEKQVGNWSVSRLLVGEVNAQVTFDSDKVGKTIVVSTEHNKANEYCEPKLMS